MLGIHVILWWDELVKVEDWLAALLWERGGDIFEKEAFSSVVFCSTHHYKQTWHAPISSICVSLDTYISIIYTLYNVKK